MIRFTKSLTDFSKFSKTKCSESHNFALINTFFLMQYALVVRLHDVGLCSGMIDGKIKVN